MERSKENIAVWLVPTPNESKEFAGIIGQLARRFDAVAFEPHLTLQSGDVDPEFACDVVAKIPARTAYELVPDGLHASEKFTQTLFLRFRPSDTLNQLRLSLGQALRLPADDHFDPHLSLLYQQLPLSEKEELARTVTIARSRVTFTGLAVIAHPVKITTRKDVEAWRVLHRRQLA